MSLDVRRLRYFVAIVEARSLSRAARELNVAQPALSQHVLAMEAELGVVLLHRGAKGVQPTEEGLRLLEEAHHLLERFGTLSDRVRGTSVGPSGMVRVGMPGTISEQIGTTLVEAARLQHPQVRIRIVEAMSGFVLDWLRGNVVDLAFLYDVPEEKSIHVRHVLTEEIYLFGSAAAHNSLAPDELTLSEVLALPLIVPSPSHGLRHLIDLTARSIGRRIEPEVEIDSYRQIKQLVARGNGFGLLPLVAIRADVEEGRFRSWRVVKPALRRRVLLAYRADIPLSTAVRAVGLLSWTLLRDMVERGAWPATLSKTREAGLFHPRLRD